MQSETAPWKWLVVIAALAIVVAGLIEFNARRIARANMAELERALTMPPDLKARLEAEHAQVAAEDAAIMRRVMGPPPRREREKARPPSYDPRPLASDERCIDHVRFRIDGRTWTQLGTCR